MLGFLLELAVLVNHLLFSLLLALVLDMLLFDDLILLLFLSELKGVRPTFNLGLVFANHLVSLKGGLSCFAQKVIHLFV